MGRVALLPQTVYLGSYRKMSPISPEEICDDNYENAGNGYFVDQLSRVLVTPYVFKTANYIKDYLHWGGGIYK